MVYHDAPKIPIDLAEYKNRGAEESDCGVVVGGDTAVRVDGRVVLVYMARVEDPVLDTIAEALPKIKYSTASRTGGMVSTSRIFGYAPRNAMRNQPCRAASLAGDQPLEHRAIADGASVVARLYAATLPAFAGKHADLVHEKVKPEYRMGSSMFTSGIVNHNNPLRYHFDSGNFANCCSGMLAFRRNTGGGHLCIPELNLRVEIADRSLLLFDGQGLLHGVTPIRKWGADAYRFTVVYYSLQQLWNCDVITDEIARMRHRRTAIEHKRATGS